MHAMAGDSPGFEEAARALFAGDIDRLRQLVGNWPNDVRNHVFVLAGATTDQANSGECTPSTAF